MQRLINRTVRVDEPTWRAAERAARDRGTTVSEVIRRALLDYVTQERWP